MTMFRTMLFTGIALAAATTQAAAQTQPPIEAMVVNPKTQTLTVQTLTPKDAAFPTTKPGVVAAYVVGNEDIYTYACLTIDMPPQLLDRDGGTVRMIMQHELDGLDELHMIDEHIAVEWTDDKYGKRGRYQGRYGWTRQSGGGDYPWIMGDPTPHNIAAPWGWAWIDDFERFGSNAVLPEGKIRLCSHPHVTTRFIFMD